MKILKKFTADCSDDWFDARQVGLGCLKFDSTQKLAFHAAQQFCRGSGSHLVEIKTMEQMKLLVSKLQQQESLVGKQNWWGGASTVVAGHEGAWYWEHSGTEVANFTWSPGQPNGVSQGYTQLFFAFNQPKYYGNDQPADNKNFPICQNMK